MTASEPTFFALSTVASLLALIGVIEGVRVYRSSQLRKNKFFAAFCLTFSISLSLASVYGMFISYYNIRSLNTFLTQPNPPVVFELYNLATYVLIPIGFLPPFFWFLFVVFHTSTISQNKLKWIKTIGFIFVALVCVGYINRLSTAGVMNIDETTLTLIITARTITQVILAMGVTGYGLVKLYTSSKLHLSSDIRVIAAASIPAAVYIIARNIANITSLPIGVVIQSNIALLSLGLVSIIYTSTKSGILDDLPATSVVGESSALEAIENAVFITDPQWQITNANSSAIKLFEQGTTPIGQNIEELLPALDGESSILEMDQKEINILEDRRTFSIEVNEIDDDQGRDLGYIINLQDVTSIKRNQQRISVLNRVLRHNLRNDLNAASGFAELAASDGNPESQRYLSRHHEQLDGLVEKGEKARDIENIINQSPKSEGKNDLTDIVETTIQEQDYGEEVSVEFTRPDTPVMSDANPVVLSSVIQESVQNSIEHNSGDVDVQVAVTDRGQVRIIDNGIGIPEHELVVLDSERETDLEHGSGLGLWLIRWGMDHVGGSVDIDTSDSGTTVVLSPPNASGS